MREFVTDKLRTLTVHLHRKYIFRIGMISGLHIVPNLFALTVWLEVILWRKFRINNRKTLYFNHGLKADKIRNLKLKIGNAICLYVCY